MLILGGILLLFSWLIVPLLVVIGYGVELGRVIAAGRQELPPFRLAQAGDGLRALVVMIGYFLPMFVVYFVMMVPLFLFEEYGEPPPFAFFGFFGVMLLLFLYGVAMAFLQPAIFAVFIAEGSIGACFSPRRLKAVIRYWGGMYLGAAAVIFGIGQLAAFGFILFFVGVAFTYFYLMAFTAHISGQLARPLLPAPAPVTPPPAPETPPPASGPPPPAPETPPPASGPPPPAPETPPPASGPPPPAPETPPPASGPPPPAPETPPPAPETA